MLPSIISTITALCFRRRPRSGLWSRFGWDCEIIDYFVNQDNALFKRPTGLGSAAHDAHTALHYQALLGALPAV